MARFWMAGLFCGLLASPLLATSLFSDGFESGVSGASWEVMPGNANNQILVGDNAHAFGNGSAKQVNADPFIYYMRTTAGAFPDPGLVTTGLKEVLTVYMWDDDANHTSGPQTAAGIMLSDASGVDFYQINVNSTINYTNYNWRTALQGTAMSSVARTQGWRKLQIEVLPYTGSNDVNFYIDDTLIASGNRKADTDLNQIRLGISIKTPGSPFWYDNVDLSVVPEPASLSLLALGGLAVLRRRR